MHKLSKFNRKSKAQFFLISAVIIISIFSTISQYITDYAKVDLTKSYETQELQYISQIKSSLLSTVSAAPCERLDAELNATEGIIKNKLAGHGIVFDAKHTIVGCGVSFSFNITSPKIFSTTDFKYP